MGEPASVRIRLAVTNRRLVHVTQICMFFVIGVTITFPVLLLIDLSEFRILSVPGWYGTPKCMFAPGQC